MRKNKLLLLLALLLTAATGAWAQESATTYSVKMKDGTQDAKNWSIASGEKSATGDAADGLTGLSEGDQVTLQYTGRLKVKDVKATSDAAAAAVSYDQTVSINDGAVTVTAGEHWLITGTGEATSNKITISDGATVTLDGVNISGISYCIKCNGSATIILKDGSTNTLTSTDDEYPALSIGDAGTTLTIQGSTGVLNVTSGMYCAGIGGGYKNANNTCGNIRIEGGVITAQGGSSGAGIGSDCGPATCGDIIITGGTITAKGGNSATGIGNGSGYSDPVVCGDITIANTVTKVTATKGENAPHSIGMGNSNNSATCGTVTIGGTKYWENNAAVNGGDTYLAQATIEYPAAAVTYPLLSAATTADCGKVVCAAGHLHDAKTAVPDGCTAVGILGKVTETGHGLILALKDATKQTWNTINGWTSVTTYAGTTLKVLPDDAARSNRLTSYTTLGTTTVSNWAVAQKSDYEAIFTNLGSTTGDSDGMTYDDSVNAYITTGVGGAALDSEYWSATEFPDEDNYAWLFGSEFWAADSMADSYSVRPVLGF